MTPCLRNYVASNGSAWDTSTGLESKPTLAHPARQPCEERFGK